MPLHNLVLRKDKTHMRQFFSLLMVLTPVAILFKVIIEWPWIVLIMAFGLIPFLLYQEHKNRTIS